MGIEQNKAVVRRFVEAINAMDLGTLDELVADGFLRHSGTSDQPCIRSRDEFKEFLRREAETFPDAVETIHFLVAEADKVAAHIGFRGTQRGAMGPFPPSGRELAANFLCIFRLEQGKVAEAWVEWDNLAALVQLGHYRQPGG